MAQDGSIVINTALDNSGFEKNSKELIAAIKGLTDSINQMGQTLQSTFSGYSKAIQNAVTSTGNLQQAQRATEASAQHLGSATDGVRNSLSDLQSEGSQAIIDFDRPKKQAGGLEKEITGLSKKVTKLDSMADKAAGGNEKAAAQLQTEYRAAEQELHGLIQQTDALGKKQLPTEDYQWLCTEIKKVDKALEGYRDREAKLQAIGASENTQGWKALQYEIEMAKANLADLNAEKQELEADGTAFISGTDTAQYQTAVGQLSNLSARLDEIRSKSGDALQMPDSSGLQGQTTMMDQLKASVEGLKAGFDRLIAGFGKEVTLTSQLKAGFDRLKTGSVEGLRSAFQLLRSGAEGLRSGFENLKWGISDAFSAIAQKAASVGSSLSRFIHSPIRSILGGLNRLAGGAVLATGNLGLLAAKALLVTANLARIAGAGIVAGIKKIGSYALTAAANLARIAGAGIMAGLKKVASWTAAAARNLAKMAGRGILAGIKKLGSSLTRLGKSSKSSGGGFAAGLKKMMMYGLGVRSLFLLVNKLRTALTQGMQNLAQADPEFNAVMSSFIGSLKLLGNTFATAFAPVAKVVLPILTQLITVLGEVISRIGMLFASLTGQKTFTKATGYQYDYAEATGKATDAAEDEEEASEELQRTLAGFDDVEILKEDKQKDSKLDKDTAPASTFEEVPVDTDISNLADMLKDMWEKQDFSALGRMLGEKIRDALNGIDWESIKETLRKIATCIATFLNGFLETPGLFDAIGRTLAEALNSAFEFLKSFAENFHWGSLGTAIREGILGCLNNIDWTLIKETMGLYGSGIAQALTSAFDNPEIWTAIFTSLAEGLNSVVTFLNSFLEGINWGSVAANIATGLNAGILAIDWAGIAQLLCNLINGVFDAWYNFFTTVDWYKFGELVGTSISTVLNNVDWEKGGAAVGATINALFYALNGFIENTDWGKLGSAVIETIAGFFGELDWGSYGKMCSNIWVALFDTLSGAIEKVDWENLPKDICTTIGEFLAGFDWTGFCKSLGRLLGNAFKALISLGSSLWNTMKEFGKNVIEGGWEGICDAVANVGKWIQDNILDPFIEGFKDAFGIHSPSTVMQPLGGYIVDGLLKGITDMWHIVTDFFGTCGEKISNIWNGLTSWWDSTGGKVISGIKSGIKEKWPEVTDFFDSCGEKISDVWNGLSSWWDSTGGAVIDGIYDGIDNNWYRVENFFGSCGRWISDTFDDISSWWDSIGSNIVTGIWNGICDSWDWVCNSVSNLCGDLWNGVTNFFGINSPSRLAKDTMKWLPIGMASGIDQTADQAIDSVMTLAQAMQDEASVNPVMTVDTAFMDGTHGLENVLTSFADKVALTFDSMIANIDRLVQQTGFSVPALATGSVTPYGTGSGRSGSAVQEIVDALAAKDGVTRDDLNAITSRLERAIDSISFYLGDEDIARHANRGNQRLNRRFSTME